MSRQTLNTAVFLLAIANSLFGQESRGNISGTVTDPQGGVIPSAAIVITNIETNTSSRTATNTTGYFEVSLLNPGPYTINVEAAGFKKLVRSGLVLQVAGHLNVDLQMQVGGVTETVSVTAEAPLLETTSASGGRVIDSKQVTELPFSDMNPFALTALSAGMQWTGQPEYRRPFDNGGTSSFSTAGNVGQNEYSIDGAPVTGTNSRVGFVPSSEAVAEFKLETATFDAAYGHTSGATINVVTKSGTNTYHGSLFDQHWQQRWNATPHFTRLQWEAQVAQGKISPDTPKQASGRSNQFGGQFAGPVRIPKLFNGKNKLFFMFQYDGIYQAKAETTSAINRTVPKMAWRQGDFSDLLALDPVKYTIYDPRSGVLSNGHVTRTPFPGNKGIPVLNPLYKFYAPLYPQPNNVPGLVQPDGTNNYYAAAMPKNEKFNSIVNRIDYNISDRQKLYGKWYWNHRLADEYDWTYETKRGLQQDGLVRINKGGSGDYVWTINNATILDIGGSWTRFAEGNSIPQQTAYKPSDVGLPAYLDAKAGAYHTLPEVQISGVETVSGGYPTIGGRGTTGELKADMVTLRGNHSIKYGWSERRYWFTGAGPGSSSGRFTFDNGYTKQSDNTNTAAGIGLAWAAFMMGLPSSINIDSNDSSYWSTRYRALYVQDDWRVGAKMHITLGLRYEREGGISERFNRGLSGSFDPSYIPPYASAVEAAYAAKPIPDVAPSAFKVAGGVGYLGQPYKNWTDGTNHLLPRIGVVRSIGTKTVIRAGYGWYYDTYNVNNTRPNQDGYSQGTGTTLTNDHGLTYCCGLGDVSNLSATNNPMLDPFPVRPDGTRFTVPYGNSLGELIRQGRGWTIKPRDYSPAWQERWRLGVQRQLGANMVIEVSYNGAFAKTPLDHTLSPIPQQYWNAANMRNQAVDDYLNTFVPNPFNVSNFASLQTSSPAVWNYLNTQSFFTASTLRRYQLVRPYASMGGLNITDPRGGRNKYHDLQVSFEKRMTKGIQMSVNYTRAYDWVKDYIPNEFDPTPQWRPGPDVRPHRFVWQTIVELPFGKGRTYLTHGPLQHIVGGWLLSWIYQYQNGPATGWGDRRFFYGDPNQLGALFNHDSVHSADIHQWFDPGIAYRGSGPIPAGFVGFDGRSSAQAAGWQVATFPSRLDVLREDGIRNWDVKVQRRFRIHERLNTSFSVDLLNATNHTNFAGPNTDPTSPNFGRVDTQRGLSRIIQFNLRFDL